MIIKKPKFYEKLDEIEQNVWDFNYEECVLPFLKEELEAHRKGNKREDVHYEFSCPYCSFHSKYFYGVDMHQLYDKHCYRMQHNQPCYPINHCYVRETGRSFIS